MKRQQLVNMLGSASGLNTPRHRPAGEPLSLSALSLSHSVSAGVRSAQRARHTLHTDGRTADCRVCTSPGLGRSVRPRLTRHPRHHHRHILRARPASRRTCTRPSPAEGKQRGQWHGTAGAGRESTHCEQNINSTRPKSPIINHYDDDDWGFMARRN